MNELYQDMSSSDDEEEEESTIKPADNAENAASAAAKSPTINESN